jgi:hypothetical protein
MTLGQAIERVEEMLASGLRDQILAHPDGAAEGRLDIAAVELLLAAAYGVLEAGGARLEPPV